MWDEDTVEESCVSSSHSDNDINVFQWTLTLQQGGPTHEDHHVIIACIHRQAAELGDNPGLLQHMDGGRRGGGGGRGEEELSAIYIFFSPLFKSVPGI